jgi:Domain of unknown function (DUF4411)
LKEVKDSINYVIDSSALIQAHRTYYAFKICPGFWESLFFHHSRSIVVSIDKVKKEVNDGKYDDELKKWANKVMPASFFASTEDEEIADYFGQMITWAEQEKQFRESARAEFAADVDGWLISFAKVHKKILVTQEVYAEKVERSIPIPNVCKQFGVVYVDVFQMLKELKTQFILK